MLNNVTSSYIFKNHELLIEKQKNKYSLILSKLETLSPLKTIQRGYTITKKDNKVITKKSMLKKGDKLEISFSDGDILTEVIK